MTTKLLSPFQKFVKIESLSGILLLATTILALVWANSPYASSYDAIWNYELGITTQSFEFTKPVILWINDGLMAIFFFLIGLEIKREILIGELNSVKKLAFPLFGALGGMIIPIALFFLINQNPETQDGWGISMATDIAFSLAVLNALGKRIPLNLKIFLTAFAIVDDLGAVMVIALFYSGTIKMGLLAIAFGILGLLYILAARQFFSKFLLLIAGIAVWFLFLKAGIHPTIAGILLAFSVPVRQKMVTDDFINSLGKFYNDFKKARILKKPILSKQQLAQLNNLDETTDQFRSPLQSLEHDLHGWVAYCIIPIFALANAGISINGVESVNSSFAITIIIALVLGKGIGVSGIVLLAQKLKWITIPKDISKQQIIGVSFLAGIGFTMAIFIANLAFSSSIYLNSAKIGVLIGSLIAAVIGYIILRRTS
ncbi:Na+/H+ antiporter NhaA [Croceibacter atlanticus]|jgi:NhaA family Na+:H+ antiporter|uniref:Na(+)/H(+) antiporter NhaA n=1 Tax=Croceibacter atlanticus (strain ATCC BAA-628 / JCM 21780 / CIP 108009 / IAM 15332 / KCTC 12090 / HTCC2559) TaxID=216432 RepID=A3UB64_CROAH|nr:Na+/H+ antiporter NhaA [Croceibacter atlanticus]EAP87050.1 putative Na+/H+ antiporter [Croceibacter atlanticus HTCC2559]